jgi:hypothetical protein
MFGAWRDEEALHAFLARSPVAARWAEWGEESWHTWMELRRGRGAWGGFELGDGGRVTGDGVSEGPVAVLTRARVRPSRIVPFTRSTPAAAAAIAGAPGALEWLGIGEAPVGTQATFSLWRSLDDMRSYAYASPAHADVIRRRREEGWYSQELFARFRPLGSSGTWGGRDPLAGAAIIRSPPRPPSR